MKIAIIGGGAAGFFAAIAAKENHPKAEVVLFEKTQKLLSKVKISGGGRCNVTNGTDSIRVLANAYPRGSKKLKKAFQTFNNLDTIRWFEKRGVPLVTQDDMCVFPVSQDSQSIIDCFHRQVQKLGIDIVRGQGVDALIPKKSKIEIHFTKNQFPSVLCDKVIVTIGGSPKRSGLTWLEDLGHQIEEPVPSLFTFNMPDENIRELMGIVVDNPWVRIAGTKLISDGPLLITHWGMSGPAILKLSAFGARILNELDYKCEVLVNWVHEQKFEDIIQVLNKIIEEHPQKYLSNIRPYYLPERLWHYLIHKVGFSDEKRWSELGKKGINKLASLLHNDSYQVRGKTTFKEEFVTCGGVSLESIDFNTMQSKVVKNLYFAGEVMDIDGITGGYNFQSAWTTAYIAGKLQ